MTPSDTELVLRPLGLRDYLQRQRARFIGNFEASLTGCDVDAIHDMRVAVKRLRTVLKLAKHVQPQFRRRRAYRPLKDIYKAAGEIRDFHVQQQLLVSWLDHGETGVDEYQSWLNKGEQDACRRYAKTAESFKPDDAMTVLSRRLADALSAMSGNDVISGINGCFSTVLKSLLEKGPADQLQPSSLHAIRVKTKEARYCLEIIRACSGDNDTVVRLDTALKRVHRALGLWHDYDIGLHTINRFHDQHSSDGLWKRVDYRALSVAYTASRQDHLETFHTAWQHLRDLG